MSLHCHLPSSSLPWLRQGLILGCPQYMITLTLMVTLSPMTPNVMAWANSDDVLELVSIQDAPASNVVQTQDSDIVVNRENDETRWRVTTGDTARWPGVTIRAPQGSWDLSSYRHVGIVIENRDDVPLRIYLRVDGAGGDGRQNSVTHSRVFAPRQAEVLRVPLSPKMPPQLADRLFGMRGYPGGARQDGLDLAGITQVIVFLDRDGASHTFDILALQAEGRGETELWQDVDLREFFPMIDRWGQFIHKEWPGKVASAADLQDRYQQEAAELQEHSAPRDWDDYGGWSAGPRLEATGYFYTTKHGGKWWLVDPSGRLFWSHGVDCVSFSSGTTPVTDREFYFADLPQPDGPFAPFYGHASWAPHGYYHGRGGYRTYNFQGANLFRKYGEDWRARATAIVHQRLRSWSLNTIANWSDADIYLQRKTPYVVSLGSGGAKSIEGSTGYWGKFPDPFDPSFEAVLQRRLDGERGRSAGDRWCLGYFVDNELAWGDDTSLAVATLASPAEQPAKQVFVDHLRAKYNTVAQLNQAWRTDHASWSELAADQTPPDKKWARSDLETFYTIIAECYFRKCREAIQRVAPDNLYLGCRFSVVNDRVARAAAKYCDVIGYNLYRNSVADFALPADIDLPVIIGEFHFGALDRGMFHTGLRATANQQERAEAYTNYVTGALRNPALVGTHWFQYCDQATTGRGDGENYQIGLVDICDSPYPETVEAVRAVGASMYPVRHAVSGTGD